MLRRMSKSKEGQRCTRLQEEHHGTPGRGNRPEGRYLEPNWRAGVEVQHKRPGTSGQGRDLKLQGANDKRRQHGRSRGLRVQRLRPGRRPDPLSGGNCLVLSLGVILPLLPRLQRYSLARLTPCRKHHSRSRTGCPRRTLEGTLRLASGSSLASSEPQWQEIGLAARSLFQLVAQDPCPREENVSR